MESPENWSILSPERVLWAVVLAILSVLVNYGSQVVTLADALLWIAVFVPIGYLAFTVFALLSTVIWE